MREKDPAAAQIRIHCVSIGKPVREEFPPLTESDPTAFSPPASFGPFRVLHQIGTGVLGPVFRTYEPARDRLVAVKVFRLDLTPERARALADELQRVVQAGLDHPSIVRPIAAGLEGTLAYAASEYVAAESLDIALRHYAPATVDKVLPFITQLAGAVDFARATGIGHGALHPRDIFVSPDEACATGFGVVQSLERVGVRAPVRRPYTAPERVDGSEWGVAADVYSLAAIAYELLTARRPAGAGSAIAPADIDSEHADLVAAAITQGLAEDPRARQQSALSFAAALEAAARGERTSAREQLVAVPSVPTEPTAEMRPDGPTFVDVPQETSHDLIIQPFEEIERPPDREFDDIQLRDRPEGPVVSEAQSPLETQTGSRSEGDSQRELQWELESPRVPEPEPVSEPAHDREPDREPEPKPETEAANETEAAHELERAHEPEPRDEPAPAHKPEPHHEPAPELATVARFEREPEPDIAKRREPGTFEPASEMERLRRPAGPPTREPVERQRPVLLPVALTLLLGLFVGFLAGYLVGSRDHEGGVQQQAARTSEPGETAGAAAAPRTTTPSRPAPAPIPVPERKPASPPRASEPARQPPAATERPAQTPAGGRLAVRSTPSGAQVFVNGRRRGPTPLVIRNLAAGTYTIRLERQGFTPETRRVTLASDSARDLALTLKRAAPERPPAPTTFVGSMYIDSRPRGAKVFIDGKSVGETPMQIPEIRAGTHVVRFELAGHRPWNTTATVVSGQVSRVTGSLEIQQ